MNIRDHKHIVFGVEHYNPLGVVRSLGEAGINPIVIVLKSTLRITSKSKYISQLHMVETIEEGYKILLEHYSHENVPPFLYTADDRTMRYFDEHYDELKGKFIFYNAGSNGRIGYYMNKENIIGLAKECGINVAKTWVVDKGEIPEDLEYPIITKTIASTIGAWKGDVFICHSEDELRSAYEKIQTPRLLLQKWVKKKDELCMEGFSVDQGRQMFIAIRSSYNYLLDDQYSPYMTIKNVPPNGELQSKLQTMMSRIGYEGIYEIELLEGEDEQLYFLEINFRNSTWSYAATKAGMPLPVLWAKSMLEKKVDPRDYKDIPAGFMAMVEPHDFQVRVGGKQISVFKWMRDFAKCKCHYYVSRKDMGPVFSMFTHKFSRHCPTRR